MELFMPLSRPSENFVSIISHGVVVVVVIVIVVVAVIIIVIIGVVVGVGITHPPGPK